MTKKVIIWYNELISSKPLIIGLNIKTSKNTSKSIPSSLNSLFVIFNFRVFFRILSRIMISNNSIRDILINIFLGIKIYRNNR